MGVTEGGFLLLEQKHNQFALGKKQIFHPHVSPFPTINIRPLLVPHQGRHLYGWVIQGIKIKLTLVDCDADFTHWRIPQEK